MYKTRWLKGVSAAASATQPAAALARPDLQRGMTVSGARVRGAWCVRVCVVRVRGACVVRARACAYRRHSWASSSQACARGSACAGRGRGADSDDAPSDSARSMRYTPADSARIDAGSTPFELYTRNALPTATDKRDTSPHRYLRL